MKKQFSKDEKISYYSNKLLATAKLIDETKALLKELERKQAGYYKRLTQIRQDESEYQDWSERVSAEIARLKSAK